MSGLPINRVTMVEGYDSPDFNFAFYGDAPKRKRKKPMSKKQKRAAARLERASHACSRKIKRKGNRQSFQACMAEKLKKKKR